MASGAALLWFFRGPQNGTVDTTLLLRKCFNFTWRDAIYGRGHDYVEHLRPHFIAVQENETREEKGQAGATRAQEEVCQL